MPAHLIYGLQVAANRPIPGLAVLPDSDSTPDVRVHLKNPGWPSQVSTTDADFFYTSPHVESDGKPALRVASFAGGAYFGFFYADGAAFAMDREGRDLWVDWPEGYAIEDAATYLVGPVLGFILRLRGVTPLHASGIVVDERAIALVGQPGAGKSTTAAAFAHLGFAVLSDDVVPLQDHDNRFFVAPGYPRVNLWPDSVRVLHGSEDALPLITPTWGKHYLQLDQNGCRFQPEQVPLGAIYLLDGRDPNLKAPVIEELPVSETLMALVANTYVNYALDRQMRHREFDLLSRLVARVPVRRIRPSADPSAVLALCQAIAEDARRAWDSHPALLASGAI